MIICSVTESGAVTIQEEKAPFVTVPTGQDSDQWLHIRSCEQTGYFSASKLTGQSVVA